jgi:hypothetical protein
MATAAEHTIKINRRNLLPTAAAAITAPIVPSAGEAATATGTQPGPMTAEAPDQGFSRENARRLLENHKAESPSSRIWVAPLIRCQRTSSDEGRRGGCVRWLVPAHRRTEMSHCNEGKRYDPSL